MPRKGQVVDPTRFTPAWWAARSAVDPSTGCHIWQGTKCRLGYGRVWKDGRSGRPTSRVRYESAYGPIPPGMVICHRCDNPSCVNVDHLFLSTQQNNLRDMFNKGRGRPHGGRQRHATRYVIGSVTPARGGGNVLENTVTKGDILHLISPIDSLGEETGLAAGWRHVTGVPQSRKLLASVSEQIPQHEAAQPVTAP